VNKLWTFSIIVAVVFAVSVLLGLLISRWGKSIDRMEREPRYRRRWMYYGAAIYGVGAVYGVSQVLSGNAPPQALLALPIPLLFIWLYLRAAKSIKIPPN
jgi:MFS family permease